MPGRLMREKRASADVFIGRPRSILYRYFVHQIRRGIKWHCFGKFIASCDSANPFSLRLLNLIPPLTPPANPRSGTSVPHPLEARHTQTSPAYRRDDDNSFIWIASGLATIRQLKSKHSAVTRGQALHGSKVMPWVLQKVARFFAPRCDVIRSSREHRTSESAAGFASPLPPNRLAYRLTSP
jgi:hypothetical protein